MSDAFDRRLLWRHIRRRRPQIRAEVEDELGFHLEMRVAELQKRGLNAAEARREALRQFGDLDETREVCVSTDQRKESQGERRRYLDELKQDIVHGFRHLRRRWQVTVLAGLTLGVGIGASTAIFSATDHVLIRPLPYLDADRVMTVWETDEVQGIRKQEVSSGNFVDWRKRSRSFSAMGLWEPWSVDLATDGPPIAVPTNSVTEELFEALGVKALHGRLFSPEEYVANGPAVVLISEGYWRGHFDSDPNVLGRTLLLENKATTIVGVLPASVKYPDIADFWVPKALSDYDLNERFGAYMRVVGRLRPGVSLADARADLERIASQLKVEYPRSNDHTGVNLVPLREHLLGPVEPALLTLLGAVGFVLLIACANVASLLLASGAERGKELAVRASLGAGRRRLLHQMATESVLLAVIGGLLGVGFAYFGIRALVVLSPPNLPRVDTLGMDARVLGFSALITLTTAFLFGLAPAVRFSRPDLLSTLRASGRSLTSSRASNRLRSALVISEVALALVLLIGAGLLIRSFSNLRQNDLGFDPANRVTLQTFLWDRNPTPELRLQRIAQFEQAFRTLAGVGDVGVVSSLPFHPHAIDASSKLRILHRPVPAGDEPTAYTTIASSTYFRAMGIPLKQGRMFDERDRMGGLPVVLINETVAGQFFQGEDPVGKKINIGVMASPQTYEVVGVVGDVRPVTLDSEARPEVFRPLAQTGSGSLTFIIRTQTDAAKMLPTLRARFWEVDAGQSIYWAASIETLIGDTLVERRFNLVLLGSFSAIALILATIGIYGLISFATQQRTNEIGVRMALGARGSEIIGMIVNQGVRLALPGIALGVLGAVLLTRFIQNMLYGVTPTDVLTYTQLAVLMLVIAAVAAFLPARRAVRGSPLRAIMKE
ncbi:MAG: ABC transporter permease [Gemmatimonadota bacterium]